MFTLGQIKTAHSKVKSGADFPAYIKEIKAMGVARFETFVIDGHTDFYGDGDYKTSSTAMYDALKIAKAPNSDQFKSDLKTHQNGQTDFLTFCEDCAKSGIEKWTVSIEKMTCTYYDTPGNEVIVENIPTT